MLFYLANELVLAALLCATAKPLGFEGFGQEWVANAARSMEAVMRIAREVRASI